MKERVSGIISFIGGLAWGLFGVFAIYKIGIDSNEDLLGVFMLLVPCISVVMYVIWTKFGQKDVSELDELEKTKQYNQLLKLKIEQKELEKKLEEDDK